MRARAAVAILAVAALGGGSVAAATKDPLMVVLQKADVPAKATYSKTPYGSNVEQALASRGIKAKSAAYHAAVTSGPSKALEISGAVFLTASVAQATKLFQLSANAKIPNKTVPVQLPAYGDDQRARYFVNASTIQLLVRKRAVVWQLEIKGGGLLVRSKAALTADVKTYAPKQARRVGAG